MPCSPTGDLPDPGIESGSPALKAGSSSSEPPGKFHSDVLLAAAATKSLKSCLTLCDPIDGRQPTRLPRPWDFPGKNTGVGCHFPPQCMKVKSEREVAQSCPTLHDPCTAAHQAPPSIGLSRQEYWSGVPLPSPISS